MSAGNNYKPVVGQKILQMTVGLANNSLGPIPLDGSFTKAFAYYDAQTFFFIWSGSIAKNNRFPPNGLGILSHVAKFMPLEETGRFREAELGDLLGVVRRGGAILGCSHLLFEIRQRSVPHDPCVFFC